MPWVYRMGNCPYKSVFLNKVYLALFSYKAAVSSTPFKTSWGFLRLVLFYAASLLNSGLRGSQGFQKQFHLSAKTNKIKLASLAPLLNAFPYNSLMCRLQPKANKAISPSFYDFLLIMLPFCPFFEKTTLTMMLLVYRQCPAKSKNGGKERITSNKALA